MAVTHPNVLAWVVSWLPWQSSPEEHTTVDSSPAEGLKTSTTIVTPVHTPSNSTTRGGPVILGGPVVLGGPVNEFSSSLLMTNITITSDDADQDKRRKKPQPLPLPLPLPKEADKKNEPKVEEKNHGSDDAPSGSRFVLYASIVFGVLVTALIIAGLAYLFYVRRRALFTHARVFATVLCLDQAEFIFVPFSNQLNESSNLTSIIIYPSIHVEQSGY